MGSELWHKGPMSALVANGASLRLVGLENNLGSSDVPSFAQHLSMSMQSSLSPGLASAAGETRLQEELLNAYTFSGVDGAVDTFKDATSADTAEVEEGLRPEF